MTSRLPSLKATDVVRALKKGGFIELRSSGSHLRLAHATDPKRQTTVSVHRGKDIPRGTLHDIIKQAGLSVDEFIALL